MSPLVLALLPLFGFFGWPLIALLFARSGMRGGSLRVASHGATVVFRKPLGGRVFGAMMCVWLVASLPLIYWIGVTGNAQRHQTAPALSSLDYVSFVGGLCLTGAFGGLMLFLAGPNDLSLDLDRRTYRFVSGWPVCPRVQTGPWEDMAGIYVSRVSGRDVVRHLVRIAWRREKPGGPLLGSFGREEDAGALAEELSASLSLPRVTPPPPGKTAVDPVSQRLPPVITHPYRPFRSTLFGAPAPTEPEETKEP